MPLSLFEYNPDVHICDSVKTESKFLHTFGGRPENFQLSFTNAPSPVHLIYRIDLSDPVVPKFIDGLDFLPLCCPFNFGAECFYEIISSTQVEVKTGFDRTHEMYRMEAPDAFELLPTSFSKKPYDPTKAEDVVQLKGLFGWDHLSQDERDKAVELARGLSSWTLDDAPADDWTYEDVIRCMFQPPFVQANPNIECANPNCNDQRCKVIAIQDNALECELIWQDPYVQTIWSICKNCSWICVTNQCT